jgi:hypothetical protein
MRTKTRPQIIQLFNECMEDANTVPLFINLNKKEHKLPAETISSLISELSYLIKPIFINEKDIFNFVIGFELMASIGFDGIKSLTLYLCCNGYINDIIDEYIINANKLEEYETVKNFTIFKKLRNKYQNRNYTENEE